MGVDCASQFIVTENWACLCAALGSNPQQFSDITPACCAMQTSNTLSIFCAIPVAFDPTEAQEKSLACVRTRCKLTLY
jgi:hypothetical protein